MCDEPKQGLPPPPHGQPGMETAPLFDRFPPTQSCSVQLSVRRGADGGLNPLGLRVSDEECDNEARVTS